MTETRTRPCLTVLDHVWCGQSCKPCVLCEIADFYIKAADLQMRKKRKKKQNEKKPVKLCSVEKSIITDPLI